MVERQKGTWRAMAQEPLFRGQLGRVRAVAMSPDGHLYFSVTNRDYRGTERPSDDRIFRVTRR